MLLFGVILMLLVIFLCAKYRKNGFIKIIAFYFFAISFNILVGTIYLSKSVQPAIEFKMDTQIFLLLYNLRIPYSTIIRMFNFSILIYMLVSVIYIKYISKCGIKRTICMIIPSLYFCITSDPSFTYRMFILSTSADIYDSFMSTNLIVNEVILIIYTFAPALVAVIRGLMSNVFVKRRDLLLSGLCTFIINLFMYIFVIDGMFKEIIFNQWSGVIVPMISSTSVNMSVMISFMWIVVGIVCTMILFLRPFWFYERANHWKSGYLSKKQNKNISMVLHTYKNAFIGMSQQFALAHNNIEKGEYTKALNNTNVGKAVAEEYLEMLNRTLNVFRIPNEKFKKTDILVCIKNAMDKLALPKNEKIKVDVYYDSPKIFVFGNEEHLTEMILNLLVNSIESLQKKRPDDPRIKITLFCEEELLQMSIMDNGLGVKKKNIRKIFKPFFTTKGSASSGIGLSYVVNVVKQHHGYVRLKSVPGEYAEFKIVLPIYQGRETYAQ